VTGPVLGPKALADVPRVVRSVDRLQEGTLDSRHLDGMPEHGVLREGEEALRENVDEDAAFVADARGVGLRSSVRFG
jgi:hypothetical protein